MRASTKDRALLASLLRAGINATEADARTLRRAERTLQRWGERECGDGSGWHIERDETTDKPRNLRDETGKGYAIPDLEAGALRRVKALCDRLGAFFYYQSDPRGCTLYVAAEPLSEGYYTRGVPCCE